MGEESFQIKIFQNLIFISSLLLLLLSCIENWNCDREIMDLLLGLLVVDVVPFVSASCHSLREIEP